MGAKKKRELQGSGGAAPEGNRRDEDLETAQKIERLRSLALLHHLPEAKLKDLTRVLGVQKAEAGTVVFEEGSAGDRMFMLAEGQVRIEKAVEAGGFKELALLSPGDFFGEMALLQETPRSARAVSRTDSTLFVLEKKDLFRWLDSEPVTALGFFVELLRGVSQRLRRTSEELVLLFDLSHLTLQKFDDEASFLRDVLRRTVPHMDGEWSGAAYLYNEYNEEVTRVATEGPRGQSLPRSLERAGAGNRWIESSAYCVALPSKTGTPLGYLVMQNALPMSAREKAEFEITLTAVAHLLASALQNIKHEAEEALRARLQHQKLYGTTPF